MDETQEPRPLEKLLTLDYEEMTSEEIEMVIEWRAQCKANETEYQERMAQQQQALLVTVAAFKDAANAAATQLADLETQAMKRLDEACKMGSVEQIFE